MEQVNWHNRFTQQALWTADLRRFLFSKAGLENAARVLEVGCGTGAVLATLPSFPTQTLFGIDLIAAYLNHAHIILNSARFTQADALALPFAAHSFDIVYCHYLLLWIADPAIAIAEMRRVLRPGGWILVMAEPEYGGRVDFPPELEAVGKLQEASLRSLGADPRVGRRLYALLNAVKLEEVFSGVLGGQWHKDDVSEDWRQEWRVLQADLGDRLTADQIARFYKIEKDARENGERLLFVPTFYAAGRKPDPKLHKE